MISQLCENGRFWKTLPFQDSRVIGHEIDKSIRSALGTSYLHTTYTLHTTTTTSSRIATFAWVASYELPTGWGLYMYGISPMCAGFWAVFNPDGWRPHTSRPYDKG